MKVIVNLGMGVESSAILTRYLTDPTSRDFPLEDLIVVTAQTGDEFADTGLLVERHLLPLLRERGVRYVQLARRGAVREHGSNVVVLEDSTCPTRVFLEGGYRLSDELLAAGTIPTTGGNRKCSMKAKGEPIDEWLATELGNDTPFRQHIGFNLDETRRADDDAAAQEKRTRSGRLPGRRGEYPLIAWGWDRARCEAYLLETFGVTWAKSCCAFCPFSRGKDEIVERFRRHPEQAAAAMWLEHLALALNPRMKLYVTRGVREVIERDENVPALRAFQALLTDEATPWAVYRVRRLYRSAGLADRDLEVLETGSRAEAHVWLGLLAEQAGAPVVWEEGSLRVWLRVKEPGVARTSEEMLVACPRIAQEKAARGWTEEKWQTRTELATVADAAEGCP